MPKQGSRSEVESHVSNGDQRFAEGDASGALECADQALSIDPRHAAALSLRAAALDALGGVSEASAAYDEALRLAPRDLDLIGDAAEFYLRQGNEEGDPDWLARARDLTGSGAALAKRSDPGAYVDFVLMQSDALQDLGEPNDALSRVDEALRDLRDEPRLQVERGLLLFETCRFDEARVQLDEVLKRNPGNPAAHHTLGLIAERAGRRDDAVAHFREAHAEAPDDFPLPVHFSADEFDGAVEDALGELPTQIRDYLSNVAITVDEVPRDDDLLSAAPPLSPSILGIFRGSPFSEKASMDPWSHFPSSIVLYQRNLERFARTRDELVEQIRVTLLHEVGHFLGLDEDQLRDLGLD